MSSAFLHPNPTLDDPFVAPGRRARVAEPPPPGARPKSRFSPNDIRARALRRFWIGALGYSILFAMALVLVGLGFLPRRAAFLVTAYCALGHVGFYILVSSRRAQRFKDPACAYAQVLFGISVLLLGCALIPKDRVAAIQMLFLIVAFDFTRLSRQQVNFVAATTVVGLCTISFSVWWMTGDEQALRREGVALAMAVVYVPLLIGVGRVVRQLMGQQSKQRAALAEALEQLQALAERDALTGASNRRHGEAVLAREALRHSRQQTPWSLALLDIDLFKRVNDTHGHAAGDAVLVALVARMGEALPTLFTVARWGGEEFLIVMPETRSNEAVAAMRRLRSTLSAADWTGCAPALRVDVSIGVCEFGADGSSVERTLELADAALYRAKADGRGRVVEHLR